VVDGASRSVGLRIQGSFTVAPVVLRLTAEPPHPAGAEEEAAGSGADGPADGDGAEGTGDGDREASAVSAPERPPVTTWVRSTSAHPTPVLDAYSLRLVATRTLYDDSVNVRSSPSLAGLAPALALRLHPFELERIGVASGGRVRVSSNRTSLTLEAIADAGVPRGSAALLFNLPGAGAADLIDATAPVTDVRVETT
jgi:anaerobic selenocysteine-containing dehydrogenase